jgi:hypothetical protein
VKTKPGQRPGRQERYLEDATYEQSGLSIARRFYAGRPAEYGSAIILGRILGGCNATRLRELLLRQHKANRNRLADYLFAVLCRIQQMFVDGCTGPLEKVERMALLDPLPRGNYRDDLWGISFELSRDPNIFKPMLVLCFYDRTRFRRAFDALLALWFQMYKPGSAWRRRDALMASDELAQRKKQGRRAVAAEVFERAGLPPRKNRVMYESAVRVVTRDIKHLHKKYPR